MKQTAVDFLMGKLFDPSTMVSEQIQWFEQAKEMEKEQVIESYEAGIWDLGCRSTDAEQYYEETFKTNEK
jgi:hypothetical protein